MSLTNSQHDSIMRVYDRIRINNKHLQEERYKEITTLFPEYIDIENKIIELSYKAASDLINSKNDNRALSDYNNELNELNKKKADILTKAGKPSDYLNEIYTCPNCKDTGYIGHTKCSCFTKKAVDLIYHDSNLKNITANENFSTFSFEWYDNSVIDSVTKLTPYNNMHKIVHICHQFVEDFDKSHNNLLLYGNTGVGKTFLTNCMAKELLDSSHSVIYLTAIELVRKFEERDFHKNSPDVFSSDSSDCNYILDSDLLIIDDLGTEVANTYTTSVFFYCINERILRNKSVIISTNLSLAEIRDNYTERIFSRLTNSYTILKLFGNDIRILKKTGKKPGISK